VILAPAPDWTAHLGVHGPLPDLTGQQVLDRAAAGDVRGRGGGGFPLSRKLIVAAEHGRGTVIGNCSEGEPASQKDALLLVRGVHLVIDGLLLAGRATRAPRLVRAAHEGAPTRRLRAALSERPDADAVEVLEVPARYVAGEASALTSALAGGPALPQQRSAPLATGRRPHLVQNAETLACLALLARGRPADNRLVTVRGAVPTVSVREVEAGTTIGQAIARAQGPTERLQALLVGGYFGRWLPPAAIDTPLTHEGLRSVGGVLGAGVVVALPASACGLAGTAQVLRYLADQSARRCGPCRNGLPALASAFEELAAGTTRDVQRLDHLAAVVRGRGACAHPDGASALAVSALEVFAADVARHRDGACGRLAGDALGVPA
jgi:NADH:ubiquinone oxidoreductase subunit F (NADH-binding)